MKQVLMEMLVCPSCLPDENRLNSQIKRQEGEDIIAGSLTCRQCGRIYSIESGIAFLDPRPPQKRPKANSKYETGPALSSYMWSHYLMMFGEPKASDAYNLWADLIQPHCGVSIDAGAAVGRFTFEMSQKSDFAIGVDSSLSFIQAARDLMRKRRVKVAILQEGHITREETVFLPQNWDSDKVEFIVGDAEALPFRSKTFSSLASLNLIDKVSHPIEHLKEINRIAKEENAQFLFSDPFSWSTDIASEKDWLGGTRNGPYSGRGIDNVAAILKGKKNGFLPEWKIEKQGHVWWKLRNHANHFEVIRSCYIKAIR